MKAAAVQMRAALGDVESNLKSAEHLANQAFSAGAEIVILPEFFPSAMAFHPKMLYAARPLHGEPMELLKGLAKQNNGVAGGSFNAIRQGEVYNTFVLAFPDGSVFLHDKDQPTMWENCYYIGGTDDGVLDTPLGPVGVSLCWEFVRSRTARRLRNKVKLIVGGSCWWDLPKVALPGFSPAVGARLLEIMQQSPPKMARMVGAPVIHAAHAGDFKGKMPLMPGFPYESNLLGQAMITDAQGKILAKMDREEGYIMADIDLDEHAEPSEEIPQTFWIPDLPLQIRAVWAYQNRHGRRYYRTKTKKALGL
ncbi:Nitrilase/cyanide hydratase and apolipoprotein N-acyltransferase [Desulfatibacillum aliphaticivorans]|uniref:Nitrilase/cyanide hydratase and apolipoprotein N-acyltransferase n=1 Tax=Desulfatibacillum aliphaticivorans TaxID=218208 RepID=B8FMC8_DESAL|nr:carbon-nitrogen hydrolase family protein [Desulfatibacillum aliphaticivorans]ACL05966.1 Nitrilase/cyanide hydratase and apolipoprotein N-acyltransferase [Desulfatibacillum aliphaticivorans]